MKNKLILITGKSQSGKSSSVEYIKYWLTNHYGNTYSSKEYSFAEPLKQFLINVMGLGYLQCYGTNEDKNTLTKIKWQMFESQIRFKYRRVVDVDGLSLKEPERSGFMTGREVMEVFGTDICRRMNKTCWAETCKNNIVSECNRYNFAFVSDVRFPDELEVFKPYDPVIIRLLRNPLNRQTESDTALDNYVFDNTTHVIDNTNMSISDKNYELEKIMKGIING